MSSIKMVWLHGHHFYRENPRPKNSKSGSGGRSFGESGSEENFSHLSTVSCEKSI